MGLREKLLAAPDLQREEAQAPELAAWLGGEKLYVRELSATERDEYETSRHRVRRLPGGKVEIEPVLENLRARLLVKALCDEQGARVLADGDAAALGRLSGRVLDRLFEQAERLSGLAKGEEDSLKNGPGAGSCTD